jgi:Xaa-Pro aminopeptidase
MSTFDQSKPVARNSYDSDSPPNLVQFMLKHWKVTEKAVKPLKNAAYHRARRDALARAFPGQTVVVATGERKVRANDQFYPFRPGSDFFYLTGCHEPDCVLMLVPSEKGQKAKAGGHTSILFVEPNPGKTDATFFTDRVKGELWEGPRPGVPELRALTGVDECRPLHELPAALAKAGKRADDAEVLRVVSEARLLKDEAEIAELTAVVKATKRGFEDVIRVLATAKTERELETTFWARARQEGNDVGYGTIAAAGHHACTLHWKKNDGALRKQDLLLLDAGIEGDNLYTADITRTLPIGGEFTREQRQIYDLVRKAQVAATKEVRPGNDFMQPNRTAMEVLAHGLEELGILPMSAEEALKPENLFYKRYTLHNVSHMLGLDVHDCAKARAETYKFGKLQPGMVLTVEPGLYFQPDDLTVPARYRGIGVRIEDDVVVTDKGCKNLAAGIPADADEVEAWMQEVWKPAAKATAKGKAAPKVKAKAKTKAKSGRR